MPQLKESIQKAFQELIKEGLLPEPQSESHTYHLTVPQKEEFGDFTTNAAMVRAKDFRMNPRKIGELLAAKLEAHGDVASADVAGAGFVNMRMTPQFWHGRLVHLLSHGNELSSFYKGAEKPLRILLEFVSANPTGPLHFGHGRGAVVGDVLGRILEAYGHEVRREYYINDAGNQMKLLGETAAVRYRQAESGDFNNDECPENGYMADYLKEIARELLQEDGGVPQNHDPEWFREKAKEKILKLIQKSLNALDIQFDEWFSERSLETSGAIDATLENLKERGLLYRHEKAWSLKTSDFGDEKDRVVIKSDGVKTYFASDIAYHQQKFQRGFDLLINIWGADHHGYVARLKAAVKMCGYDPSALKVLLVKLVNLKRDGEVLKMSKRGDSFITLDDVTEEIGSDAVRFNFLLRSHESSLDLDLATAKEESKENPVYYTQYAFARISSVFAKAEERGIAINTDSPPDTEALSALTEKEEIILIKTLNEYPAVIRRSAELFEAHLLTYYILDLSAKLHRFYYNHRVLVDDERISRGRLYLLQGVHRVLYDGLKLLGINTPASM